MSEVITSDLPARKRGRPPLLDLDPGIIERISAYITDGMYVQSACILAGIHEQDYYRIMDKADAGDRNSIKFRESVKRAEAKAEYDAICKMRNEKGAFLPEATFLERRFRDRWGRSERKQIDQNVNITVQTVNYNQLMKQIAPKNSKNK